MPRSSSPATSQDRGSTPEGTSPFFDFGELEASERHATDIGRLASDEGGAQEEEEEEELAAPEYGPHDEWQPVVDGDSEGEQYGEWYIVTIATYVNIYPEPDHQSSPVLGRLARSELALVFEWDVTGTWRRCRSKREDRGLPVCGWVKVLTQSYGPLLKPVGEAMKLDSLCKGDSSGVLRSVLDDECEEVVQRNVPGMLREKRMSRIEQLRTARHVQTPGPHVPLHMSDGRLVLGPAARPSESKRKFRSVLVMGAHHTCTTALTRELEAQFFVTVENNFGTVLPEARPPNHKHLVLKSPPDPQDALVICLVKDPCFWLQSLTRHGATYAVHALKRLDLAQGGGFIDMERHLGALDGHSQEELLDAILGSVEFMGDVYPAFGALRVWEATVRSYFNDQVYPLWRTAVVRCEDFLFSFEAVMQALSRLGLERRPNPPPPNGRRAKGGVIHMKARDREEALRWYGHSDNRWAGLQQRHIEAVFSQLGELVLNSLNYDHEAVGSWSARCRGLFIAGTWDQFRPFPMAFDGNSFVHSVMVNRRGEESFQLLLEGRWDAVCYPSVADAGPAVRHIVLGPDAKGHGRNWTIGRHAEDAVLPGDVCNITVAVDPDGVPTSVSWEVVGNSAVT